MNNQIIQGSLRQMAQASGKSLAESFLSCDLIAIVDTSGSMSSRDSRGQNSRYEVACEELAVLQNHLPGKVAVITFGDKVQFCPAGVPVNQGGGTDMAAALNFVKVADKIDGMRFVLISDGEPNDPQSTLKIASGFKNRIDVIYVGPENQPAGRDFLTRLAQATGGKAVTADRAQELTARIETLLLHK